ncbi:gamma tubulin-interacting protein [Chloropicon primus]|uniref:Gamma-tubulin complex component n=2 Tax=Chloropicon primus TaxID=1764295 RepID=A0A5B8MT91_9CHLO|nr:gamma tubulin-interacting protein [Chloropicon primus]|eukprot:QDZ23526.1 gamma tubulin-interacting protein [Chloropicon primus]
MVALVNEVVCALGGHAGEVFGGGEKDVFVSWTTGQGYRPLEPEPCPLRLEEDTARGEVLALGEKQVVNELVKTAFHYREVSRFATVESQPGASGVLGEGAAAGAVGRSGAYRRAFAFGLVKVLGRYRQDVVRVERRLNSDGDCLPLTELQSEFCQYQVLLSRLHRLVCKVSKEDVRGCELLRYCESFLVCGIPCMEETMKIVVNYMYEVLYKQLGAWLVYGRLLDREGEFFIRRTTDPASSGAVIVVGEEGEGDLEKVSTQEWHGGFEIHEGSLPMHVSRDTAETILFIGKSQRILSHFRNNWRRLERVTTAKGASAKQGQRNLHSDNFQMLGRLEALRQEGEFSKPAFDGVIDYFRKEVASHMWQLVVIHAELPKHLQALKDYFLMERGNFHQVFLTEARSLMQKPPNPSTADSEMATILNQTAQMTGCEADPLLGNVSLRFSKPSAPGGEAKRDGAKKIHLPSCDEWDNMCLRYKVSWPLGLILTSEVLGKYHHMFQFLWRLRRVNVELDDVWTTLRRIAMRSEHHSHFSNSPQVWHLRHQMVHLLCNYQVYVQVDVIEAQYAVLQQQIASAENFLDLENALGRFTSVLITQSFLDITSITSMLDGIIKLCLKYARSVYAQLDSESPLESLPLFSRFQDDFQRRAGMLFTVLKSTKLSISSRAPHLHQFLARLNYNDWCSKLALESQLNTTL